MRLLRNTLAFLLGVSLAALLLGGWAYWTPTMPGDKALLVEAMAVTGRTCEHDQKAANEDGERGRYCEPPAIRMVDLMRFSAYGMYDPFTNPRVVYVNSVIVVVGSPQWKSTVLHEYVHYLQWLHGDLTPRMNPCKRAALEIEAHEADTKAYPVDVENTKAIIDSYKLAAKIAEAEGACN